MSDASWDVVLPFASTGPTNASSTVPSALIRVSVDRSGWPKIEIFS